MNLHLEGLKARKETIEFSYPGLGECRARVRTLTWADTEDKRLMRIEDQAAAVFLTHCESMEPLSFEGGQAGQATVKVRLEGQQFKVPAWKKAVLDFDPEGGAGRRIADAIGAKIVEMSMPKAQQKKV